MADAAVDRPLQYLPLSATKTEALRNALGSMVALANPLDYHTYIWNKLPEMTATFTAMLSEGADLSFLVIDFPHPELPGGESWMVAVQALIDARKATQSAVAIVATLPENIPNNVAQLLLAEGIPSLYGIEVAMDAAVAVSSIGKSFESCSSAPVLIAAEEPDQCEILTEHQSKQLLQQAGLDVPCFALVNSCDEARAAASKIGYPVVLKLVGTAHKTEHEGVVLNLADEKELGAAATRLFNKSDQLLVESFCDGAIAELLVGIVRESSGLLTLTLGAGGVLTELLHDTRNLLLPVTADEIQGALDELKIASLLRGYRSKPAANLAILIEQIQLLCDWAEKHADDLQEVEVNPLLCLHDRVVVADALIRMKQTI